MHDPADATVILGRVGFGIMIALAVGYTAAYMLGTGERREARRRSIRRGFSGTGWLLLSMTFKYAAFAFPSTKHQLTWLWIPAFVLAILTWSSKLLRWFIRRRKRIRPIETPYTRTLRAASRRKR